MSSWSSFTSYGDRWHLDKDGDVVINKGYDEIIYLSKSDLIAMLEAMQDDE